MIRTTSLLLAVGTLCTGGCQSLQIEAETKEIPVAKADDDGISNKRSAKAASKQETAADASVKETAQPKRETKSSALAESSSPRARLDALATEFGQAVDPLPGAPLELEQVTLSVVDRFPLIRSLMEEARVAAGKQQSARGAFDVKLLAESLNMPQGYYKNYRHLVKAEQATWMGGAVYGQYRLGDGDFQPWYGERETNEGGEFKVGMIAPLLRGRAIDERRAEIARADLAAAAVDPQVQRQLLESVQVSSYVYWSWVAAGQAYLITQDLLEVAEQRDKAVRRQVELGNLGQTELQQNERLIASRQAKLIEAKRKLQGAAIKLSLFLRDENGEPIIPDPSSLPAKFPEPTDPHSLNLDDDIAQALTRRPELRELQLARNLVNLDLRLSENELLPNLNAVMEASKDTGAWASPKGDKTPFELEAGLLFDVPLQRNKAYGKVRSAQGKLTQLSLKQQFTVDKIVIDVQDAHSALIAAYDRIGKTRRSVELARQLVKAEYRSFELGNSDILRIGIQEGSELDARYLEIDALLDYFQSLAQYHAAIVNE
jgi:outer membrane protein TolC